MFIFAPTWRDDPIRRAYFSNGLVQPSLFYYSGPLNLINLHGINCFQQWGRTAGR